MAKSDKPVDVEVSEAKAAATVSKEPPFIEIKTGLTEGRKYFVTVRPRTGKPVLIAVHL